jgi:NADH-quinone oxidoreductase subunit K
MVYLFFPSIFFIFIIGVLGLIINKRNILISILCIELILLSSNIGFIFCSILFDDIWGQIISLYVLTIAAAESAVGLSILLIFFEDKRTIFFEQFIRLRG